jgi:hypothetical protein
MSVPEIRRTGVEVKDLKDPKELKKFFDSLSEFGLIYKYDSKRNRVTVRGEIDWCDDEFIGINDKDIEMGVSVSKSYTIIRLRQRVGDDIKIKDVRMSFPIKFHYFHEYRELILDLDFKGTHS